MLKLAVPEELIYTPEKRLLPRDWDIEPAEGSCMQGSKWLRSNERLCYRLPSAVIPEEFILMLNPNHADFSRVRLEGETSFRFDSRLAP
jgi:RES domain-containing protein